MRALKRYFKDIHDVIINLGKLVDSLGPVLLPCSDTSAIAAISSCHTHRTHNSAGFFTSELIIDPQHVVGRAANDEVFHRARRCKDRGLPHLPFRLRDFFLDHATVTTEITALQILSEDFLPSSTGSLPK